MLPAHTSPDGFSLHHLHQPPGSRRPSGEKSRADARAAAAVLMLVVIALDSPFTQAALNGRQQSKDKTILSNRSALNGQQGINICVIFKPNFLPLIPYSGEPHSCLDALITYLRRTIDAKFLEIFFQPILLGISENYNVSYYLAKVL